jgi:hypothetical protein
MNNSETIEQIKKAEKIAWIVFIGIGLNYLLLTLILA